MTGIRIGLIIVGMLAICMGALCATAMLMAANVGDYGMMVFMFLMALVVGGLGCHAFGLGIRKPFKSQLVRR